MSKRKSRLSSLDFIIMASCYSAKGDKKKALTALTAASECEDFDTAIATLAMANDASMDVEFEDFDEETADDNVGLSQTAIDEIEELDFESDGEETAAEESEEFESESDDPQFEISKKTRDKIKAATDEDSEEFESETENSDDLETAGFGDKYSEILAQLETESESEEQESEEEQETAAPKLSRAERNMLRMKKG